MIREMIEYFTEGIVLKRHPRGELDGNIILYTKDFGKVTTFAKSIRKITSKLSGHMLPGNIVHTRIIEKNNVQAVDTIGKKSTCDTAELLKFLDFLDSVIPPGEQDIPLWHTIRTAIEKCNFTPKTYKQLLEILGFVGEDTKCAYCRKNEIAYFSVPDIMLLCMLCRPRMEGNDGEIIKLI